MQILCRWRDHCWLIQISWRRLLKDEKTRLSLVSHVTKYVGAIRAPVLLNMYVIGSCLSILSPYILLSLCQACLDHVFELKRASCLVNPRAVHETELNYDPTTSPKKVSVFLRHLRKLEYNLEHFVSSVSWTDMICTKLMMLCCKSGCCCWSWGCWSQCLNDRCGAWTRCYSVREPGRDRRTV